MGVRTVEARTEALARIVKHLKDEVSRNGLAEIKLRVGGSITVADVRSALNRERFIVKTVGDTQRSFCVPMAARDGLGVNLESTWKDDLR